MNAFLQRFAPLVLGALSGFDRLFFRGTLRNLAYAQGLQHYLWANRIPYKDFAAHSEQVTARLVEASLQPAQLLQREIRYLNSHDLRLEDEARAIAARDGIIQGPICVFRRVEPCMSFAIHKNRATRKLQISYRPRQCLHLYHYQIHPLFGFMHARIQTWFPFHAYVCLNGHEWLARQMDQAGLRYRRADNCFPWVEDLAQVQTLFDQQLQASWPTLLDDLAQALNPIHGDIFARYPTRYYWSVAQCEWSSDVLFRSRADLEALYPRLVRHAITTYGAVDVLRFLGRKIPEGGQIPASFPGEVQSGLQRRQEGVRLKHWLNHNSEKLYDKGSVLRCECTIQEPKAFWVFRAKEGDPDGDKAWRTMRRGIADLHRRGEVSQAANQRYLEALAAVADTTPLRQWAEPLCQRVPEPTRARPPQPTPAADQERTSAEPALRAPDADAPPSGAAGLPEAPASAAKTPELAEQPGATVSAAATPPARRRRVRGLNPLSAEDSQLLEAVSRHEFLINGLRNRDLRARLYATPAPDQQEERRRSAAVGRKLRLLRAHGLLHRVPKTHRYMVSEKGRLAITALLAARDANADLLTSKAA